jgi:hypothetical protein
MLRASMIRRSDLSIALLAGEHNDEDRTLWYEAQSYSDYRHSVIDQVSRKKIEGPSSIKLRRNFP